MIITQLAFDSFYTGLVQFPFQPAFIFAHSFASMERYWNFLRQRYQAIGREDRSALMLEVPGDAQDFHWVSPPPLFIFINPYFSPHQFGRRLWVWCVFFSKILDPTWMMWADGCKVVTLRSPAVFFQTIRTKPWRRQFVDSQWGLSQVWWKKRPTCWQLVIQKGFLLFFLRRDWAEFTESNDSQVLAWGENCIRHVVYQRCDCYRGSRFLFFL